MAFIRTKKVKHGRRYYQLVRNYREAGKHRQEMLCHFGKHSSLQLALQETQRKEEALQEKAADTFKEATKIRTSILSRYSELLDGEIPSRDDVNAMPQKAYEEYEAGNDGTSKDPRWKRWDRLMRTYDLVREARRYHEVREDAFWYDDRANEAVEKKDKLLELKQKYPHL